METVPLSQKDSEAKEYESVVKNSNERRFIQVLHDVTLSIDPGSLVGVAGAIGSGKSSLISSILGEVNILINHSCNKLIKIPIHYIRILLIFLH